MLHLRLPFIYLLVKEMWGEVPLPSSVLWCRAVSSPLPEPPCSLRSAVSAGPAAHGHITNPRRQHVAQPPHGPAPCPHVLCKTVPGGSQGKASPTCGTPPACSRGHQCGHRTGFRASLGQRTSWRGERAGGSLAGRGHPGWQRGCPCHALPLPSQPGIRDHRAPSGATSMPLTQLQGFSTSWHPQFQLSKHLPFTLAVPLQSQQAKRQEKRTCMQDATVALLTPSPTPTTQILGHLCTGTWFCSAEDTPLARADQAPPCSSSAGTRGEESPISWTDRATAQLSGTPRTQRSGEG